MSEAQEQLAALRQIVGADEGDDDLKNLLKRHNGDVNQAANAYLDSGVRGTPAPLPIAQARPQQAPPEQDLVQVICPAGVAPGQQMQVQAPSGMQLRVTVPQGIRPGQNFLVRCPPVASYPGLQQRPTVV